MLYPFLEPIPMWLSLTIIFNLFLGTFYLLLLAMARLPSFSYTLPNERYNLICDRLDQVANRAVDLGLLGSLIGFAQAWTGYDGSQAESLARGLASGINTSVLGIGAKIVFSLFLMWLDGGTKTKLDVPDLQTRDQTNIKASIIATTVTARRKLQKNDKTPAMEGKQETLRSLLPIAANAKVQPHFYLRHFKEVASVR